MTEKKSPEGPTGSKNPIQVNVGTGKFPPAVESNGFTFTAAIGGTDENGKVVSRLSLEQSQKALENLQTVLGKNGLSMDDVLRCAVFITDIRDIIYVERAMEKLFKDVRPAFSILQVQGLPGEQKVAVEAIAIRRGSKEDIVDFMG